MLEFSLALCTWCLIDSRLTCWCASRPCAVRVISSMPFKAKPKPPTAAPNVPQLYHCLVCGEEHDKGDHGAKPVNWQAGGGVHGAFYVGNTLLLHPKLPRGWKPSTSRIVDGKGKANAANGNMYVGYCCHATFQSFEASDHHRGRGEKRKAAEDGSGADLCTRQALSDLRVKLEVDLWSCGCK